MIIVYIYSVFIYASYSHFPLQGVSLFQTLKASKAPSDAVQKMGQVLQALGANCLQEHSLPRLEFQLGPSANATAFFLRGLKEKIPQMVKI